MAECTTASAPSSSGRCTIGVAKVLSTATIAPCLRSTTAAMSTTFSSGLVGVSTQISLVSGAHRPLERVEVGLVDHVVLQAEAGEHLVHEPVGAAVEVLRQDTWSPAEQCAVSSACVAAMPLEKADAEAALELAQRALERRARRVRRARVVVVLDELAGRGLHVGRGLVDRRYDGPEARVGIETRVHHARGEAACAFTAPATRAGPRA